MPSVSTPPLTGPGTFSSTVNPATGVPLIISANGTISFSPGSTGYIVVEVLNTVTGGSVCGIADTIRPSEQVSGTKSFNISVSNFFANAASLQISVSARQLDGQSSANAPTISSAALSAFTAA
jgi:hypothetical protein